MSSVAIGRGTLRAIGLTVFATACGGQEPTGPPAPTPVTTSPGQPPPPAVVTIEGTITATVTGETVGTFSTETMRFPARVSVSAQGFLARETFVYDATPTVDLIRDVGPFDLEFYRQFVRNTLEAPETMEPLRRQQAPPRIYLRTVDEAGVPIPDEVIESVLDVLAGTTVSEWTGGSFGTSGIERGTETRQGQAGWLTFKWPNPMIEGGVCGRAAIAGTWIELNYLNTNCACGGLVFNKTTIRHEIGHAMGFWHTDSSQDVMYRYIPADCDQHPTVRERFHAAVAYARPVGNRDPDVDPDVEGLRLQRVVVD